VLLSEEASSKKLKSSISSVVKVKRVIS